MLLPIEFDILVIHIIIIKNEYFWDFRQTPFSSRFNLAIKLFLEIINVLIHLILKQSLTLLTSPTIIFKLSLLLKGLILLLIR